MSAELLGAAAQLSALAFSTSITPGPNNLMLLSSGQRFGLRRTLAHCAGVTVGLGAMLALSYAGLRGAIGDMHGLVDVLSLACAAYLLKLAWPKPAAQPGARKEAAAPIGFVAALGFQFVNPKVWGMTAAGVSMVLALPVPDLARVLLLVGVFCAFNLPCITLWAAAGARLDAWLRTPSSRRRFEWTMTALLLATAATMAAPALQQAAARFATLLH